MHKHEHHCSQVYLKSKFSEHGIVNCAFRLENGEIASIKQIVSCDSKVYVLANNGKLYSDDKALSMQHTTSDPNITLYPVEIVQSKIFIHITASEKTFAALTNHGDLYMSGCNLYNQLSFTQTFSQKELKLVTFPQKLGVSNDPITYVACGPKNTAIVTKSGNVVTWGGLKYKTAGLFRPIELFKKINFNNMTYPCVTKSTLSDTWCAALTKNGRVYMWCVDKEQIDDDPSLATPTLQQSLNLHNFVDIAITMHEAKLIGVTTQSKLVLLNWNNSITIKPLVKQNYALQDRIFTHGLFYYLIYGDGTLEWNGINEEMNSKYRCWGEFSGFEFYWISHAIISDLYTLVVGRNPSSLSCYHDVEEHSLLNQVSKLFASKENTDVELVIGEERLRVHNAILSSRCLFFHKLIKEARKSETRPVQIDMSTLPFQVNYQSLLHVLEFIYTTSSTIYSTINTLSAIDMMDFMATRQFDTLIDVTILSYHLQMKELQTICTERVLSLFHRLLIPTIAHVSMDRDNNHYKQVRNTLQRLLGDSMRTNTFWRIIHVCIMYFQNMYKFMSKGDIKKVNNVLGMQEETWRQITEYEVETLYVTVERVEVVEEDVVVVESQAKKSKRRKRKTNYFKNKKEEESTVEEVTSVEQVCMEHVSKPSHSTSPEETLANDLMYWFDIQDPELHDIVIKVLTEGVHKTIYVDRAIITSSPYFAMLCKYHRDEIVIEDIHFDTLMIIFKYMYGATTNLLNHENVIDLFTTSDRLSLPGLKLLCEMYIVATMNVEIEEMYELAELYHGEYLLEYIDVYWSGQVVTSIELAKCLEKRAERKEEPVVVTKGVESNVRSWGTMNWNNHFKV